MSEIVHKLFYPIIANGVKVHILKLRRPTLGDSLAADCFEGNEIEKEIHLLASLCNISPEDLQKLDLKDYKLLQEKTESFLN